MTVPAPGPEWSAGDEMVEEESAVLKECVATWAKPKSSQLLWAARSVSSPSKVGLDGGLGASALLTNTSTGGALDGLQSTSPCRSSLDPPGKQAGVTVPI